MTAIWTTVAALGPTPPPFGRRRNVPIPSLLRRNPAKIIPFILVSVLSAASACYAADPTLDGGHISSGAPTHGVVLHLHGCDGLVRRRVIGEWLSRLQQMGFKVYAPNSFAERRPPVSCKPPFPNKREIYALRLDQTIRVIKELRTKHPESKLYIWGHSEGAGVANLIAERVDGVITTGYQCGFRSNGFTNIAPNVPLIALMGSEEKDWAIREAVLFSKQSSMEQLCKEVFKENSNRRWRQFKHLGQLLPITDPAVLSEVKLFVGPKEAAMAAFAKSWRRE
jgi:dienelactone hydrolase